MIFLIWLKSPVSLQCQTINFLIFGSFHSKYCLLCFLLKFFTCFYFLAKKAYFKMTLGWKRYEFHQSSIHSSIFSDHLPYSIEQTLPCIGSCSHERKRRQIMLFLLELTFYLFRRRDRDPVKLSIASWYAHDKDGMESLCFQRHTLRHRGCCHWIQAILEWCPRNHVYILLSLQSLCIKLHDKTNQRKMGILFAWLLCFCFCFGVFFFGFWCLGVLRGHSSRYVHCGREVGSERSRCTHHTHNQKEEISKTNTSAKISRYQKAEK